jgi:hypothetical protein
MDPEEIVAASEEVEQIDLPPVPINAGAYAHFPYYYATDEEEREYSLDNRRWREGDHNVKRIMLPGDPDAPPMRFTGHASNGRKREVKKKKSKKRVRPNGEERGSKTIRLPGFTRGEKAYYHRNSGCAIERVEAYYRSFLKKEFTLEVLPRTRSKIRLFPFEVYGLTDEQYQDLLPCRQHVALDLKAYARIHGAAIIRRYDGVDACNA